MTFTADSIPSTPPKNGSNKPRLLSFRSIAALILREMNTTYGRSPLGYLWAVLQPLGGIALLVIIFSTGFRNPPIGTNFAIFYATGLMPFMLTMELANKLSQALNYSRQLLVYPRISFLDAIVARATLTILTHLLVSYLLIGGILLLFDTRTSLNAQGIAMAYAMAICLGFGLGTLLCFFISLSSSFQQAWGIFTRPLLLVSGVIFIFDRVPEPYRSYLWYNPIIHVVGEMRSAFYLSYEANYVSVGYVMGVSLCLGLFGLLFLRRYHLFILYS